MVGVDVRVEHVGYPPAATLGQPDVDLRFQSGVYYGGLAVGPDDVGESALPGAAHLHHLGPRTWQGHVRRVPGEAPGLHAPLQGEGPVALAP